jgi:hypothetical protein
MARQFGPTILTPYERDSGKLFYDADGAGGSAGIHFATLTVGLALTNADFSVA